jgi:hypothetical protein
VAAEAAAVDQVMVLQVATVDPVLLLSNTPLNKYLIGCYNPKYLKRMILK